jgi:integrase
MTRLHLKYVNVVHKSGRMYFYFRRAGSKRIALPGLPGSTAFMNAYAAALNATPESRLTIGADRSIPGTVNACIAAFYESDTFRKNKPITRSTDRNILEAFRSRHGDKRIALMEERHVRQALSEKVGKPSAQRNLLRVLRVLLTFAIQQGLRKDNPAALIKLKPLATAGYHTWTEAELLQYEQHHPVGSKPCLALALLLYTAQRRSDVVRLGPADVVMKNGMQRLVFTQSKTSTPMDIPVAQPLAEIIAASPMVGVKSFLVTDYGKPFTAAGFGNWFRDQCDQAGLHHCTAHGLRKAFLKRMAEANCNEDYIASISGHKNMDEIRTYVRAANKAKMADDGMARTLAMFPVKGTRT